MIKLITFISLFSFTLALSSKDVKDIAKDIKNDMAGEFLTPDIKVPVKIAVLNFEEQSEDAKKYKISNVISNLIAENFIKDRNFIVVEREKLENVFKELKLSALGVVDEKEIKRTGLILGVDWLVMGSISDNGEEFLIQARIVNVETALVKTATSSSMKKDVLIKESQRYLSSKYKTVFKIVGGNFNSDNIKYNQLAIGLELEKNISESYNIGFGLMKALKDNTDFYFTKRVSMSPIPISDIIVKDIIKSITVLKMQLNYKKNLLGLDFKIGLPLGMNFIESQLEYSTIDGSSGFGMDSGSGLKYKLPASYDKTYISLIYGINLSIEKSIKETFVIGFDYTYLKFL